MDKYESEKVMKDFQKLHDKIKRLEKTNKALRASIAEPSPDIQEHVLRLHGYL